MNTPESPNRVGRPRKLVKRCRVNITLDPATYAAAARYALNSGRSLSSLVDLTLRRELSRAGLSTTSSAACAD